MYGPARHGWQQGGPPPVCSQHGWQVQEDDNGAWWNNDGCWMLCPIGLSDAHVPHISPSQRLIQFLDNHTLVDILVILKSRNIWSFADLISMEIGMKADVYLAVKGLYSPKILGLYAWTPRRKHNIRMICNSNGSAFGDEADETPTAKTLSEITGQPGFRVHGGLLFWTGSH